MDKMHKFYIGHNIRFNDVLMTHSADHVSSVVSQVAENFGIDGYTLISANGIYKGTAEQTTIVEVVGISDTMAKDIKSYLEFLLWQDSVLLVSITCDYQF